MRIENESHNAQRVWAKEMGNVLVPRPSVLGSVIVGPRACGARPWLDEAHDSLDQRRNSSLWESWRARVRVGPGYRARAKEHTSAASICCWGHRLSAVTGCAAWLQEMNATVASNPQPAKRRS
jgi:hypothetical protein